MKKISIIVGGAQKAKIIMDLVRILQRSDIKIKAIDIKAEDIHTILESTSSLDFLLIDKGCTPETRLVLAETLVKKKLKCNLVMFSLKRKAKNTKFYAYYTVKQQANDELSDFVRDHFCTTLRPRPSCVKTYKDTLKDIGYFFKDLGLQWKKSKQLSLA